MEPSKVHNRELNLSIFKSKYTDGAVPFSEKSTCGYCGSLHPSKVVALIQAGVRGSFADMKYGWPHKAYFYPAPEYNGQAKFYTVHLQDATKEERRIIEQHLGLQFTFTDGGSSVSWELYQE